MPFEKEREEEIKEATKYASEVADPLRAQKFFQRLAAKLVNPKTTTVKDTFSHRRVRAYYVIVGRGTAAIINHTTLRQSKKGRERIGKLPVVHVGLPDPWQEYHAHGMGQPPYLLNLPGYHARPDPSTSSIRSGMRSTRFGELNKQEWELIKEKCQPFVEEAWVACIQKRGGPMPDDSFLDELEKEEGLSKSRMKTLLEKPFHHTKAPYRLLLVYHHPELQTLKVWFKLLYAMKIDICTGAGRPTMDAKKGMKEGRSVLWIPPARWSDEIRNRLIMNAPEALMESTPWAAEGRVAVAGGGGIGLNMIERAEDVGCPVDWLPRTTLNATFNLPRNDTVVWNSRTGAAMQPGELEIRKLNGEVDGQKKMQFLPAQEAWRFGEDADIEKAKIAGMDQVQLELATQGKSPVVRDRENAESKWSSGESAFPFAALHLRKFPRGEPAKYERLFVANGIVQGDSAGTANHITKGLQFNRIDKGDGRYVGLWTVDQAVRMLGAAAQTRLAGPAGALAIGESDKNAPSGQYFFSLPYSAVPPGFIFSGVCIALANGYFDELPNENANTANEAELKQALTKRGFPGDASILAKVIIARRRLANGYVSVTWSQTSATLWNTIFRQPEIDCNPQWLNGLNEMADLMTEAQLITATKDLVAEHLKDIFKREELKGLTFEDPSEVNLQEQQRKDAEEQRKKTAEKKAEANAKKSAIELADLVQQVKTGPRSPAGRTIWEVIGDHPAVAGHPEWRVLVDQLPTEYRMAGAFLE
jgi:hypothetical protein